MDENRSRRPARLFAGFYLLFERPFRLGDKITVRDHRGTVVEIGLRTTSLRTDDDLQVMIPNALQPAQIEEVFLYPRLGRAIVLVKEDQLSLAIGRRGHEHAHRIGFRHQARRRQRRTT